MDVDRLANASQIGRPRILSETDLGKIHRAALDIVASIGMNIQHPRALELLREHGCTESEGRVRIPPDLVEKTRESVPSRIMVFDRQGQPAMELGGYNSYFGSGSDLMSTWDLESGELRESCLQDTERSARLCDALPNIDFVMSGAWPNELEARVAFLHNFRAMVSNTTKPLVVTAEDRKDVQVMWQVGCALRGGAEELAAKPYFIVYGESVSPLRHMDEAIDKLLYCADAGIPCLYTPAPLVGGTGPVTMAGALALGLAEYYQGMVVQQLARPGAPLIFGIGPLVLDLTSMQSSYSAIEFFMGHTAQIELARWLDVPNWAYGGMTDSHSLDCQAGLEIAEVTLLDMLCGSNLTHDAGYQGFGLAASLEQIVVVDEFVSMNRRLLSGIEVNDETLALDAIADVGPGGEFISHRHTRRFCREAQWRPTVLSRASQANWEKDGRADLNERARRKALAVLASHEVAELPQSVSEAMDALILEYEQKLSL
jgi:trimethylamine---corrinoid protein Co-methyltransferase